MEYSLLCGNEKCYKEIESTSKMFHYLSKNTEILSFLRLVAVKQKLTIGAG